MVDLFGSDKGNISLPPRLQSPEVLDGEPDDLKQVMIVNMQKAFYQVRITDIAKRIQRLQSRNKELEDHCVAEKLLRSQKDVKTVDQIAQLNRQIFSEMEKITDHQKRIQAVKRWMEEEKQAHLDKVEAGNKRYAKTRMAITVEIKVLNAKINTLEEYKVSKTDLRNKLIAGDNLIAQRDADIKQRCEQIQRKFKIGREKLKKEMYARLQGLAGTFQMEVAASLAKPMHRLMRENIFVKNELIDIVRESVPKKENIKETKQADPQITSKIATLKKDTVEHLITSKIQRYLLATVKEQHTRVKDCLENLKWSDNENKLRSVEISYGCTRIQSDKVLQHISRLETGLHRQQTQLGVVNYLRNRSNTELQRCIDVLYDAKYAVACALKMNDTGKHIQEMGDRQLMFYLMDILSRGDTQRWRNRTPSLATVPPPEEAYKIGDLGFDASHIEFRRSIRIIQKKPSKLRTLDILTDLEFRLSGISATSQIRPWQMNIIDLADRQEPENLSDKINVVSSSSLVSQEEEFDHKPAQSKLPEDEESVTDGVQDAETEKKIESEAVLTENETAKRVGVDNNEAITGKNESNESEMLIEKSHEAFSEDVGIE